MNAGDDDLRAFPWFYLDVEFCCPTRAEYLCSETYFISPLPSCKAVAPLLFGEVLSKGHRKTAPAFAEAVPIPLRKACFPEPVRRFGPVASR